MMISILSAFFASLFFSIIFNIAKKNLIYCGMIGAIGWAAYLLIIALGKGPVPATFMGSISITIISYIFAVKRKTPVSVFMVPGIIPLVPGYPLYRSIYYYTLQDYASAQQLAFESAGIAIAIAIAVITISAFHRFVKKY